MSLTGVVATQLWHHTYCGGGLCDLPAWTPPGISRPIGTLFSGPKAIHSDAAKAIDRV
jgi:hypothetical protein